MSRWQCVVCKMCCLLLVQPVNNIGDSQLIFEHCATVPVSVTDNLPYSATPDISTAHTVYTYLILP